MRGKFKALSKNGSLKFTQKFFLILLGVGIPCFLLLTGLKAGIAWSGSGAPKSNGKPKRSEAKDTPPADKTENLSLRVKGEFKPLDSIPKLEIRDKETYLLFKYDAKDKKDKIELEYSLEKDGKTIEGSFKLKPAKTINLNNSIPEDSLKLDILSDSILEKKIKGIELVISTGKGKELFKIPLTFIRKQKIDSYVIFRYDGDELGEIPNLPYNTDSWKSLQIQNNTGGDISVSYQIAKISSKGVLLDAGTMNVNQGKAKNVPWGEKTPEISSVTLRFKVTSEDEPLDTTFVINTSAPPIDVTARRFFGGNWLPISLILLILGLGCFIYYLWGKNIDLTKNFHSSERLVKEKEKEINKLKDGKAGLLTGSKNLETGLKRTKETAGEDEIGSLGITEAEEPLNVSWDKYERIYEALKESESDLKNKTIELTNTEAEFKELERKYIDLMKKQTDLTEEKTSLEQELKAKEEIIKENDQEIGVLKGNIQELNNNIFKLKEKIDKLEGIKSQFEKVEYPQKMNELLKNFIDQLDKTR